MDPPISLLVAPALAGRGTISRGTTWTSFTLVWASTAASVRLRIKKARRKSFRTATASGRPGILHRLAKATFTNHVCSRPLSLVRRKELRFHQFQPVMGYE